MSEDHPLSIKDTVVQSAAIHPDWTVQEHLAYLITETALDPVEIAQPGAWQIERWMAEGRRLGAAAARQLLTDPDLHVAAAVVEQALGQLRQRYAWARRDQARAAGPRREAIAARADAYSQAVEIVRKAAASLNIPLPPGGRERD